MAIATSATPPSASTPQYVDNPPNARRTMEALRDLGYDSYASILDIIDNSIDAVARQISVSISEQKGDILISIEDDGCGMGEDVLSEALRLGSDTERETTDLGKFGMGMVTASIGLSRRVEVLTREEGGPLLYGGFDLDDIAEQDRFIKELGAATTEQQARFTKPHGTVITLSKTDRISNRHPSQFANILKKRIGQVFRKFLKSGVVIEVNAARVEPIDYVSSRETGELTLLWSRVMKDGREVGGQPKQRNRRLRQRGGSKPYRNPQSGPVANAGEGSELSHVPIQALTDRSGGGRVGRHKRSERPDRSHQPRRVSEPQAPQCSH